MAWYELAHVLTTLFLVGLSDSIAELLHLKESYFLKCRH